MVKTVGNISIILFLILNFLSCSATISLDLKAFSTGGQELKQAAVGESFIVEVSVLGAISTSERPNILGLDNFDSGHAGFEMRTTNGQSSIKYKYNLIANDRGLYEIGPAEIKDGSKKIKSKKLILHVGDEQILKNGSVQGKKKSRPVILHLFSDKENDVVTGEKIKCNLRFYYLDGEDIEIERIISPDTKDFNQSKKEGIYKGRRKINGDTYNYLEWQWNIFPLKPGKMVLHAHRVDYIQRVDNGFFPGLSSFFSFGAEPKRIYSNRLNFTVGSLPEYDGVVDAVGNFKSYKAYVDHAIAKEGDGIVLTLEIEGNGDFENIDIKELEDMPNTLKYYDSKRYIVEYKKNKSDIQKKRFEFIVQGIEKGEFEIPRQKFTFFDTKTREYKTLKTSPVMLKILPQSAHSTKIGASKKDQEPESLEKIIEDINPIDQTGIWYRVEERKISFWFFMILVFIPLFFVMVSFARVKILYYCKRYAPHMLKKYAFSNATKHLKVAFKNKKLNEVYPIFIRLFAERFSLHENKVSQSFILKIMQENNFSTNEISDWDSFFVKISSFVFSGQKLDFDKEIFNEALGWIQRFGDRL